MMRILLLHSIVVSSISAKALSLTFSSQFIKDQFKQSIFVKKSLTPHTHVLLLPYHLLPPHHTTHPILCIEFTHHLWYCMVEKVKATGPDNQLQNIRACLRHHLFGSASLVQLGLPKSMDTLFSRPNRIVW
jgi:hypothetical protein